MAKTFKQLVAEAREGTEVISPADAELPESFREQKLQDRSTPIITTCGGGGQAALAAKTLKEMGFTNVAIMDGGTRGWKEAGLPVEGAKG